MVDLNELERQLNTMMDFAKGGYVYQAARLYLESMKSQINMSDYSDENRLAYNKGYLDRMHETETKQTAVADGMPERKSNCPFCGSEPTYFVYEDDGSYHEIGCTNSNCNIQPHTHHCDTKAQAVTDWETRIRSNTPSISLGLMPDKIYVGLDNHNLEAYYHKMGKELIRYTRSDLISPADVLQKVADALEDAIERLSTHKASASNSNYWWNLFHDEQVQMEKALALLQPYLKGGA